MTPSRNHSLLVALALAGLLGAAAGRAAAQAPAPAPVAELAPPAAGNTAALPPAAGTTATAPVDAESVSAPVIPDMSVLPLTGAGRIRVTVSLDRAVIRVGELIHYTLKIEAPANSKVAMPQPGTQFGQFLIRDYSIPGDQREQPTRRERARELLASIVGGAGPGATVAQEFKFTITAYSVGDLAIPVMPVLVTDPAGREHLLHAESARVRVAAVTNPEDLTIRDIKPPRPLPVNYRPALPWLLLPVGLIAVLAVLWWRLRQRRAESAPMILRPEDEVALEELAALAAEGLLETGDYEPFYTRLSYVLRRYLALRYSIYALEYTTSEITGRLGQVYLEHADFDRIREILEEADRVKFARTTPALEERSTAVDRARGIVERTRRPAPAPERMAA